MEDKGIQVAIGSKRQQKVSTVSQSPIEALKEERATQCGSSLRGSYGCNCEHKKWRYDDLVARMQDKEMLVDWLMAEGLIAGGRLCPLCNEKMTDKMRGPIRWLEVGMQTSRK